MKTFQRLRITCADFEPGALSPYAERRLRTGLTLRPCMGGVLYRGEVWGTCAQLNTALLTHAQACLERARASGGESNATGRYMHDKGHFLRHAEAAVYKRRALLWPAGGA